MLRSLVIGAPGRQCDGGGCDEGWSDRHDRRRGAAGPDRVRVARRRDRRGVVAYATQRTDGYFQTGEVRLASATYAITSDRVDLESEPGDADWLIDRGALGSVRLTIDPGRSGDAGLRRDRADRRRRGLPRRRQPRRDPRLRAVAGPGPVPPGAGRGDAGAARRAAVLGRPGDDRPRPSELTWEVRERRLDRGADERRRQPRCRRRRPPRHQGGLVAAGADRPHRRSASCCSPAAPCSSSSAAGARPGGASRSPPQPAAWPAPAAPARRRRCDASGAAGRAVPAAC